MTADASASPVAPRPTGPTVKDAIVRDIIRGLYDGRYEPGQRLQEAQLTATYGTSRGPVREALNALAAMQLVTLAPQRGAQVRVLRIEDAIDTLVVTRSLIGLAARLAAAQPQNDTGRDRLAASLATLVAFDGDPGEAAFGIARDAFYGAITVMSGNSELKRVLPTIRVHLIRVQFKSLLRANDARRIRDYRRIAEAILAGRPREAQSAVEAHLDRSITRLARFESR